MQRPMFPGLQRGLMQQPQGGGAPPQAQPQAQPGGWGGMGNGWLAQQGRAALQGMGQKLGAQAWGGMDPGAITNPGAGRPGGPDRGMPPPGQSGGVVGPAQQTQQAAAGYARGAGQSLIAEDDPRRGQLR